MTHDVYLACLNAPIDFPLFSITVSFHLKSTSTLMLSCGFTQTITACAGPRGSNTSFLLSLPLPLSIIRCGFLKYILVYATLGVLFHNCY
ncbi:unnamed protein product [Hymenolepis diminuta]|uniref:Uncharacterized protein n=1 Tax=Hymenolepis diminuta TaxID=6216 RepID=A0A564YX70_HYMDI|nr:unnamed protein product [Hymenolepis diminuta]